MFNPLVLAYLGDAVWEAHTRKLEVEAAVRSRQRQAAASTADQGSTDTGGHQQPGRGRGAGRGRGGNQGGRGRGPAAAAGFSFSRQEVKQWPMADFQALVFDALMADGLPLPPSAASPPEPNTSTPPSNSNSSNNSNASPRTGAAPETATTPASAASASPPGPGRDPRQPAPVFALTAEEQDVLRWGRNAAVNSAPRDLPVLVYKKATAVEVLVAHLYLTAPERCAQLVTAAVTSPPLRAQAGKPKPQKSA